MCVCLCVCVCVERIMYTRHGIRKRVENSPLVRIQIGNDSSVRSTNTTAKNIAVLYKRNSGDTTAVGIGLFIVFLIIVIASTLVPTLLTQTATILPSQLILFQTVRFDLGLDAIFNDGDTLMVECVVLNNGTGTETDIVVNCTQCELQCPDNEAKRFGLGPNENITCSCNYTMNQQDVDNGGQFTIITSGASIESMSGSKTIVNNSNTIVLGTIDFITNPQGCNGCIYNETSVSSGPCFSQANVCRETEECATCLTMFTQEMQMSAECGSNSNWHTLQTCLCSLCDTLCIVPPTAVCISERVDVFLDATGTVVLNGLELAPNSVMTCSELAYMVTPVTLNCSHIGNQTVMVDVEHSGLSDYCMVDIAVVDNIAPTAICQDLSITLDMTGINSIMTVDNGSADNCASLVYKVSESAFNCSNVPSETVTLVVTDLGGNTDQCISHVTVEDTVDPTTMCQDITTNLESTSNSDALSVMQVEMLGNPGDACGIDTFTLTPSEYACSDAVLPPITYTFETTDVNLNTESCMGNITTMDIGSPVALCNALIMVDLESNGTFTLDASDIDNGSSDNCGIASLSVVPSVFSGCPLSDTVTLFVEDPSTNTGSCMGMVMFADVSPPTMVCADNVTIGIMTGGPAVTVDVMDVDAGSVDACDTMLAFELDVSVFTDADVGSNAVVLTATDDSANANTCSSTVEIYLADPMIMCPSDIVEADAITLEELSESIPQVTPTAENFCTSPTITTQDTFVSHLSKRSGGASEPDIDYIEVYNTVPFSSLSLDSGQFNFSAGDIDMVVVNDNLYRATISTITTNGYDELIMSANFPGSGNLWFNQITTTVPAVCDHQSLGHYPSIFIHYDATQIIVADQSLVDYGTVCIFAITFGLGSLKRNTFVTPIDVGNEYFRDLRISKWNDVYLLSTVTASGVATVTMIESSKINANMAPRYQNAIVTVPDSVNRRIAPSPIHNVDTVATGHNAALTGYFFYVTSPNQWHAIKMELETGFDNAATITTPSSVTLGTTFDLSYADCVSPDSCYVDTSGSATYVNHESHQGYLSRVSYRHHTNGECFYSAAWVHGQNQDMSFTDGKGAWAVFSGNTAVDVLAFTHESGLIVTATTDQGPVYVQNPSLDVNEFGQIMLFWKEDRTNSRAIRFHMQTKLKYDNDFRTRLLFRPAGRLPSYAPVLASRSFTVAVPFINYGVGGASQSPSREAAVGNGKRMFAQTFMYTYTSGELKSFESLWRTPGITLTRNYTAMDNCGNTESCIQSIEAI